MNWVNSVIGLVAIASWACVLGDSPNMQYFDAIIARERLATKESSIVIMLLWRSKKTWLKTEWAVLKLACVVLVIEIKIL